MGFDSPAAGGASFGPGNIELAAKYRFLHQDSFGLDVSVFPRVFLPSPTKNIGNNTASLLLQVWVQKAWNGGLSAFGCLGSVSRCHSAQHFYCTRRFLTSQFTPNSLLIVHLL